MPVSDHALQGFCLHCRRIVLIADERSEILVALAAHLDEEHGRTSPLWQNKDFLVEPAPWRCDLCGTFVELPAWEYYTDPALTVDPSWLIDDRCSELIESGQKMKLFHRVMDVQLATNVTDREHVLKTAIPIVIQFLETQDKPRSRITHA